MKITNALWATALMAGAVSASAHHRRAHHHPLMKRSLNDTNEAETCLPQCTTYVTSYLVDVEHPTPAPVPVPTSTVPEVAVVTVSPIPEENPVVEVTVCPTPGTYTIPATTVTITQTTAVCVPTVTDVPAGTHTVGGVTTIVTEATTVVCPVATTKTVDGTVTSVVEQTTYVCPTAGTYTIGPVTTAVTTGGPITVPSASVVKPGTYCHEEIVTVIDVTNYVAVCPLTTVEVTQTVVPVAEETSAPEPTKEAVPVKETPKVETPKVEKPKVETPKENYPVVKPHKGKHYAITYSQYNDDQSCKSASDVDRDIADIANKGFGAIRLYSPECDSLNTVGGACKKHGVQIILGVFIKQGGVSTADKEVEAIKKWNQWDNINLVVIGNEAIFQGHCTAEELAYYIKKVGSEFKALGYKGQITTTEPVNIMEQYASVLCPVVDIVGCNIHPFFDPNVKPSDAGKFLKSQLNLVRAKCDKPAVVLEAGWPNAGRPNGAAVPGKSEQAEAIRSIQKEGDENIVYFTYRNDFWKPKGGLDVEQNFGCGDLF